MRTSFVFYGSWWEAIKNLPRDVQGDVLTAIIEYGLSGETTEQLKPIAKDMLAMVKPQIDANNVKFENGKKGGRPKGENEPKANQEETKKKPNNNQSRTKSEPNVYVNVNDNDNLKETSLSRSKEKEEDFGKDVDKPLTELREELLSNQTWIETLSMNNHIDENESRFYIEAYIRKLQNEGISRKSVSDAQKHFARWLRIELKRARDEQSGIHQKPNSKTKEERYAEFAEAIAAKLAAGDTGSLQDGEESALPF